MSLGNPGNLGGVMWNFKNNDNLEKTDNMVIWIAQKITNTWYFLVMSKSGGWDWENGRSYNLNNICSKRMQNLAVP